jgi:hypothetical protein
LKHLITYSNLRTYINPKGMIGMPITGRHVWGHAYEHDKASSSINEPNACVIFYSSIDKQSLLISFATKCLVMSSNVVVWQLILELNWTTKL